ncbi:hypothetical protein [Microbulbifer sp. Q7]|uniref:hypothetical protein n=1 Tax=Microbulbifer sp. Q7 TaxID=1785091 RepID=UPI0012906325|nr:hypothetical protein [Microbulbifer sp. Q7]
MRAAWFKDFSISLVCWLTYGYFGLALFWAYYNSINPALELATSSFASSNPVLTNIILYAHDAFVNFLLSIPLAYVLFRFFGVRSIFAVFTSVVIVSLIMSRGSFGLLIDSPMFAMYWNIIVMLASLPLALIAVKALNSRGPA